MTDQRPSFRLRVPRLRPSVPPRSTTTRTTQTPKRTQPIRQPPQQSSPPTHSLIHPQATSPPPPIQPNVTSLAPPPEPPVEQSTKPPRSSTPPPEPPLERSNAPPTLPQVPPPSPPHSSSESTKNGLHRASPSQTTIQSRVSLQPQPQSPSHISTQPHVSTKPPSPPTSPPHDHPSPPPSPPTSPPFAFQPAKKASSLPSSTRSPPTSPPQYHPPPPPSPPLASQPAKKVSSSPSSPTVTATKKEISPFITLAGENRGTSMCIGYVAHKRERAIHIHRKYKVNPDEITDTSSDGEESSKENEMENDSYINCNIQGINNSMVLNCSITERNPGVHLGSSYNPNNINKRKRKNKNKVKVNIPPSQNATVRRRCLRGLFMESSNSETDDPKKPRRHGCRHVCGETSTKDE